MSVVFAGRAPTVDSVRFYPLDPTIPIVARHRPLALAILADYGNPAGAADRVSAIVDWVARTAIHGHSELRTPTPYLEGTATLPPGQTWATVQAKLTAAQQEIDNAFWAAFNHDAAAILNVLLGTLQADGTRATDGAMESVTDSGAQAHYRYRSLATVRSVWCSWQHDICTLLLATLGYPSMLVHITGHDPLRVQYGERGEWGYWCATYNEHYSLIGEDRPVDLVEMRDITVAGLLDLIGRQPHQGPVWDPRPYVSASYLQDHPEGWPYWSASLDSRIMPGGIGSRLDRGIEAPGGGSEILAADRIMTPYSGAYVVGMPQQTELEVAFRVASAWPGTIGYQVKFADGQWIDHPAIQSPPVAMIRSIVGVGAIDVAPLDTNGQRGPAIRVVADKEVRVADKSLDEHIVYFAGRAADSNDPEEIERLLGAIRRIEAAS